MGYHILTVPIFASSSSILICLCCCLFVAYSSVLGNHDSSNDEVRRVWKPDCKYIKLFKIQENNGLKMFHYFFKAFNMTKNVNFFIKKKRNDDRLFAFSV